jgi:HAD superfamily hydrolase (TIGR01509 family)
MALAGVLFDVDGTLVDTNPAHVEAWCRACTSFGYTIPAGRIATEVGQGGDRLILSVFGPSIAAQHGTALRQSATAEFLALSRDRHFPLFPGVRELFATLRARGVRTALATSSSHAQLATIIPPDLADVVVTGDEVPNTKPAPDIVLAALARLRLGPERCIYVGDTPYDARAATAAGVVAHGLLTGGYDEPTLRAAGASYIWRDPAALLAGLDDVLG